MDVGLYRIKSGYGSGFNPLEKPDPDLSFLETRIQIRNYDFGLFEVFFLLQRGTVNPIRTYEIFSLKNILFTPSDSTFGTPSTKIFLYFLL